VLQKEKKHSFRMENTASSPMLSKPGHAAGTSPRSASVTEKLLKYLPFFQTSIWTNWPVRLMQELLFTTTDTTLFDREKHYKEATSYVACPI